MHGIPLPSVKQEYELSQRVQVPHVSDFWFTMALGIRDLKYWVLGSPGLSPAGQKLLTQFVLFDL